jgi:hypothetical protein
LYCLRKRNELKVSDDFQKQEFRAESLIFLMNRTIQFFENFHFLVRHDLTAAHPTEHTDFWLGARVVSSH